MMPVSAMQNCVASGFLIMLLGFTVSPLQAGVLGSNLLTVDIQKVSHFKWFRYQTMGHTIQSITEWATRWLYRLPNAKTASISRMREGRY